MYLSIVFIYFYFFWGGWGSQVLSLFDCKHREQTFEEQIDHQAFQAQLSTVAAHCAFRLGGNFCSVLSLLLSSHFGSSTNHISWHFSALSTAAINDCVVYTNFIQLKIAFIETNDMFILKLTGFAGNSNASRNSRVSVSTAAFGGIKCI
jgi:hypothetical protein